MAFSDDEIRAIFPIPPTPTSWTPEVLLEWEELFRAALNPEVYPWEVIEGIHRVLIVSFFHSSRGFDCHSIIFIDIRFCLG